MDIEANKIGGDFIDPNTPLVAKKFILASRAMLYAGDEGQEGEAIIRAITGSGSLVDGSVPILAMVIENVESKLGNLSDADLRVVAVHLAGTIVEIAKEMGDPEARAEDGKRALMEITQGVLDVLTKEESGEPPGVDMQQQAQPMGQPMGQPQGQPDGLLPLLPQEPM